MSQISTPKKRAYYPVEGKGVDRLLLWIPEEAMKRMVQERHIAPDVVDNYPDGLEIEVSASDFGEFGVDVGASPEDIRAAYEYYRERNQLPDSGIIDGATLEQAARAVGPVDPRASVRLDPSTVLDPNTQKLPEPEMTDGEDAMTFLSKL